MASGAPISVSALGVESYQYVHPLPGSRLISPRNNIVIRQGDLLDASTIDAGAIAVVGSRSGSHTGRLALSDDRKTLIFTPDLPYLPGESVSVRFESAVRTLGGVPLPALAFDFTISPIDPAQQPIRPIEEMLGVRHATRSDPRVTDVPPEPGEPASTLCETVPPGYPTPVVSTSGPQDSGCVFIAPFSVANTDQHLMILDNLGMPVFYRRGPGLGGAFDFKRQPNGLLTYYSFASAKFFAMDSAYAIVDSFAVGNGYPTDLHDLQLLADGHTLLMSYDTEPVDMSVLVPGGDPNARVIGLIVQELDAAKNVVFQWRSWDHFAITDCSTPAVPLTDSLIDYVHGNAVELDQDGNLLLSSRHLCEITKINRQTGEILWRLGSNATNNEFTFVNDPRGFAFQHDIRRLPNGHVTLFDNGNGLAPLYSRAVEYALDEAGKVAIQVWQHRNSPDVFGGFMGDVQRHADGGTLIGWGGTFANPKVTELRSDGSTAFELGFADARYLSYRAFRFPWRTSRFVTSIDQYDFGVVPLGGSVAVPMSVCNHSNAAVTIGCVVSTNPAYAVTGPIPATLAPGDSASYTVTFKPPNETPQSGNLYFRQVSDQELVARVVGLKGGGSSVLAVDPTGASELRLEGVRPNPFSQEATLTFTLPRTERVSLDILDVHGRRVANLLDEVRPAGGHRVSWTAGHRPDGVYFARLRVGGWTATRKLVLMK